MTRNVHVNHAIPVDINAYTDITVTLFPQGRGMKANIPLFTWWSCPKLVERTMSARNERSSSHVHNVCNITRTSFKRQDRQHIKPAQRAFVEPVSSCKRSISYRLSLLQTYSNATNQRTTLRLTLMLIL